MTLSRKLKLAAVVPAVMTLVAGAGLLDSYLSVRTLEAEERAVHRINDAMSELNDLAHDYVLRHEQRARQQFLRTQEDAERWISGTAFGERRRHLGERLAMDTGMVKAMFLMLVSNYERHSSTRDEALLKEAEERLVGQLVIRASKVRMETSRLMVLIREDMDASRRRKHMLALSFMTVTAVPFAIVLFGLVRSIVASLERLRQGVEIVGGGDLDHRIGVASDDEIGAVSKEFDRMSEKLLAVTVSRDELAAEMEVRIQAEASLAKELEERSRAEALARHLASFPQFNPNPVLELDAYGRISYANAAAQTFLEIQGMDPGNLTVILPSDICDILREWDGETDSTILREVVVGHSVLAETVQFIPRFRVARIYARDITGTKRDEFERRTTVELLSLVNASDDTVDLIQRAVSFLQNRSGCEAAGIRLREGDDYPYFATRGFPDDFVLAENRPCVYPDACPGDPGGACNPVLECMCGNVISGRFDPSKPFFTANGSFWTNSTTELLASTTEADRQSRTRNRCHGEGYESVALIPLHVGAERIGLLQLNDRRQGLFSPERIALWERLAGYLAMALTRFKVQDEVRTARKELERRVVERTAELTESEERFRAVVEHSPVGIFIVQGGRIVYRNPEQARLFGPMSENFELRAFRDVHPEDAAQFGELVDSISAGVEPARGMDLRFYPYGKSADGVDLRWVHVNTIPMEYGGEKSVLVSMADITRLKEMEYQFLVREKMASLGHVAAGIAHEIRNPLSGINLHLSALERIHEEGDGLGADGRGQAEKIVRQIQSASERIESVIRKVMEFSRPSTVRTAPADVSLAIENAIDFTATQLRKERITLDRSGLGDLPKCRVDPPLITQVVMNLIVNAAQAMEQSEGPKVIGISSFTEGDRIVVCISDSGPGIPPAIRDRIFDPFFTTRKDGNGIGLSFCRRVISEHGGILKLDVGRLGGAEFRIELPLEPAPRAAPAGAP